MRELDLEVRVDAVGNMFGVLPAAPGGEGLAPLMIGSHIDTVGNAGPLDGVYGVLGGADRAACLSRGRCASAPSPDGSRVHQ